MENVRRCRRLNQPLAFRNMAFSIDRTTPWGIEVSDAYCRIEQLSLTSKDSISFNLRCYTQPAGVPHFSDDVFGCEYNLSGDNPLKQAYEYLKGLPEFSSAKDC